MVTAIRKASTWPLAAQFACTLAAVIGVFVLQFPLEERGFGVPFALFLACVFMVALVFGRRTGFLAVAVSAALSALFFAPVGSMHLMRAFDLIQIECFAALAVGATITADQIHRSLISLSDEDAKKTLLLREAAHRVANNFASLDALIRQRAMASKDPKIQFAFGQASELVHIVARLNSRLTMATGESVLNSQMFVSELCEDLRACARTGITINCRAESHDIPLAAAVPLGLIINELVTNALKYAFPDRRPGVVRIAFVREDDHYHLLVEDDGVGMSGDVKGSGLGLRLLQGFSRAIKGKIDMRSTPKGTSISLKFEAPPFEPQERLERRVATIH